MLDDYIINSSTLLIEPYENKCSKVYEKEQSLIVNMTPFQIIDASCRFFGCTFSARHYGTKILTSFCIKAPIIVEESKKIIFFPTTSPKSDDCIWISASNLQRVIAQGTNKTLLCFDDFNMHLVDFSYYVIDNQITRCIKLEKAFELSKKYV